MVNYWMSAITRLRSVTVGIGLTSTLWMVSQNVVAAQLPNPALNEINPPGGQRGTTVRVNVLGRDLNGAHTLSFSHPGIVGRQVTREPTQFETGPQPVANQFDVIIPVNVPIGTYDVQAVGRFGVSTPRTFVVSDVSEITEAGAHHTHETATELPLDTVANGRTESNAIDHYRFHAEQGQTLVVECIAQGIDSRLQPVVTVWNTEGRQIKRSRQLADPDPPGHQACHKTCVRSAMPTMPNGLRPFVSVQSGRGFLRISSQGHFVEPAICPASSNEIATRPNSAARLRITSLLPSRTNVFARGARRMRAIAAPSMPSSAARRLIPARIITESWVVKSRTFFCVGFLLFSAASESSSPPPEALPLS